MLSFALPTTDHGIIIQCTDNITTIVNIIRFTSTDNIFQLYAEADKESAWTNESYWTRFPTTLYQQISTSDLDDWLANDLGSNSSKYTNTNALQLAFQCVLTTN